MKRRTFAQNGISVISPERHKIAAGRNAGSFRLIFAGTTYVQEEMKSSVDFVRIAVALALPLSLFIFLAATVEPDLVIGVVAVPLLVGFVSAVKRNSVVLAGTAVALALLPLVLFVFLTATFEDNPDDEYAWLNVFGVPFVVGFVSAPLTVLMGVGAWFWARRRSSGRRLPRVIAGIAIALGVLEVLAVLVVA